MKSTKTRIALTTLLAAGFGAAVLSGTAEAKPAKRNHAAKAKKLAKFDINGDGKISKAEKAAAKAYWKTQKKNRKGKKARRGKKANRGKRGMNKAMRAKMIAKFDANGNGKLEKPERTKLRQHRRALKKKKRAKMIAKFDANGNGKIDKGERAKVRNHRINKRFAKLDVNRSGAIERTEAKGRLAKRFAKLDKNGNGAITKAEMRAARKHHRRGRKNGKRRNPAIKNFPKPPVAPVVPAPTTLVIPRGAQLYTYRTLPNPYVRPAVRNHTTKRPLYRVSWSAKFGWKL